MLVPRHLRQTFTYRIPAPLRQHVTVGSGVLVPFGASTIRGVVIDLTPTPPPAFSKPVAMARLKDILSLAAGQDGGIASPDLLDLTRLVSERYLAPWGQCLRLALPPPVPVIKPSQYYRITEEGRTAVQQAEGATSTKLSAQAHELLARLAATSRRKGLTLATLRRGLDGPVARTLADLKRRSLLQEGSAEGAAPSQPRTGARRGGPSQVPMQAEPDQSFRPLALPVVPPLWQERLQADLRNGDSKTLLLQAPFLDRLAGYLCAAQEVLARHRTALIISPDMTRASVIAKTAQARWGRHVELLHSALAPSAREAAWRRIQAREVSLVVGTRSASFAPLAALGLICVDQEDDPSLKEEQEPRYHARDVAKLRAAQHGALLLLGSAHPSLETWQAMADGEKTGRVLSVAIAPQTPAIHVIDLRRTPYGTVLSQSMLDGIKAAVAAKTGVALFLNRKGFASALLCRDCGNALQCPQCSVSLTYYRQSAALACRYCGTSAPPPDTCPTCQGARLEPVGSGTERLEEMLRRLVPQASIARLDRDQAKTQSQADRVRAEAVAGKWDILIGTQMLLQSFPLPRVGFVGIANADAGLHAADFRAAERTYHALLDAASLAKPADEGGTVLIQTSLPSHHAIAAVAQQNPSLFYEQELLSRQALGYPPFTHLISLQVSGIQAGAVKQAATRWGKLLNQAMQTAPKPAPGATEPVTILGPVPAQHAQLRGRHRYQLLVKAVNAEQARHTVKATLDEMERTRGKSGLRFDVDVDPLEML
ncbi:MAG: primosomal protein N' [Nitrospirota bacterium]|nr:primosomal protein N' [Nitrospirota bacterium]